MLNGLDVCAGSGIGSAAFEAIGFCRTVCYVEWDAYCQRLLRTRMASGDLMPAPIWDDLRTFDGKPWRGCVDIMFGGIPCQPYSVAGLQRGDADERDLWPSFKRVLCEVGPAVAVVENVAGFLAHGGGLARVLGELAEVGYDAEWEVISAAGVGAPHLRQRVWVVAYSDIPYACGSGGSGQVSVTEGTRPRLEGDACGDGAEGNMADAGHSGPSRAGRWHESTCAFCIAGNDCAEASAAAVSDGGQAGIPEQTQWQARHSREFVNGDTGRACIGGWWSIEPDVGRVAHGVVSRVDRLRTLGNGWVPHVAAYVAGRIQRRVESMSNHSEHGR